MSRVHVLRLSLGALALAAPWGALTQPASAPPQQVVKPPVSQLWMDVATSTMAGMPELPGLGGLLGGLGGLGGLAGASGQGGGNNSFGQTRGMAPGRFVDIAFVTQLKPAGTQATQAVPAGTGLAPSVPLLPLQAEPREAKPPSRPLPNEMREPSESEPPKGRVLFYWGCSETVRPGQPRVLDFSKGASAEWASFMQGRFPRDRGAAARPGHSVWPNERDRRNVGRDASLVGEHKVSGEGVPPDLRFSIGAAHDIMPALSVQTSGTPAQSLKVGWTALPHARGYFMNAMGSGEEAGASEMVMWSSAEVPDFGSGLMDYLSPANIDQWLRERVLLGPDQTQCAIPAGIFAKASGAMLRMIAYGPELNLAHPPRPTDVRIPWEPQWAVRVRTKSTAMAMLGMQGMAEERPARPQLGRPLPAPAPGATPGPVAAAGGAASAARPDCPPPKTAGNDARRTGADLGEAVLGGSLGRSVGGAVGGLLGALGGKKKPEAPPPAADCPP